MSLNGNFHTPEPRRRRRGAAHFIGQFIAALFASVVLLGLLAAALWLLGIIQDLLR